VRCSGDLTMDFGVLGIVGAPIVGDLEIVFPAEQRRAGRGRRSGRARMRGYSIKLHGLSASRSASAEWTMRAGRPIAERFEILADIGRMAGCDFRDRIRLGRHISRLRGLLGASAFALCRRRDRW